jgi:putative membrane protein
MKKEKYLLFLFAIFFIVLIWSAIKPKDYFTWILEVTPGIVGFIVLFITHKRFRFTDFIYTLILIHCCILFVGGHYTYAEVPLFDWVKELLHGARNNYDKVGHFAQGFVPALIAREMLLRLKIVNSRAWTGYLVVSIALAISALYELIEWWTALLTGESAEAFLGTQGYIWDTQSDMFWAFAGSLAAVVLFSRYHDRKIKETDKKQELARGHA